MLMSCHIRDINLWESGALKIQWVRDHMPLLAGIEKDFIETKPFAGMKVALSVHMEAKTARLCLCLAAGGAEMYATGCNPLSTQDDVAAALVHEGLNVFAIHGATMDEYEADLRRVLEVGPNIIIDDGGDLVTLMHKEFPELIPNVIGGCEETTTGILRLKAIFSPANGFVSMNSLSMSASSGIWSRTQRIFSAPLSHRSMSLM